jgi:hypothetical protein
MPTATGVNGNVPLVKTARAPARSDLPARSCGDARLIRALTHRRYGFRCSTPPIQTTASRVATSPMARMKLLGVPFVLLGPRPCDGTTEDHLKVGAAGEPDHCHWAVRSNNL